MTPNSHEELARLTTEQKRALLKRLLLEKAASADPFPLSYGQRALWFVHKLLPDSPAYHVAIPARLRRPVDPAALERALLQLVDRHPSLRSIFVETEVDPVQQILPQSAVSFRVVEVAGGVDYLRQQVLAEYQRPFDAGKSLIRVTLWQAADQSQVLLFNIHHLVFDAWSAQILIDDLCTFYEGQTRGAPADLPPVQARYSDFVSWQRQLVTSSQIASLSNYWAGVLTAPLPVMRFPGPPAESTAQGPAPAIPIFLDPALTAELRALARSHNATMYMVWLAAFQVLLHRYTGEDDIIIGSPNSLRSQPRWLGIVGNFVNMLPTRCNLAGNPTFSDHLARTREAVLGCLAHQDFPFPLMIEQLHCARIHPASPLIQAVFNLVASPSGSSVSRLFQEDQDGPGIPFGASTLEPYPLPQQEGQFALVLEAMDTNGVLAARLKCGPGGPDPAVASAMAADYLSLLRSAVANPSSPICDLSLPSRDAMEAPRDVFLL
jgi:hypothetical protein